MPYIESEIKERIREIRNTVEPVLDGMTDEIELFEVSVEDFHWLMEQAEKMAKVEYEVENSDMSTGIGNIIDIVNS